MGWSACGRMARVWLSDVRCGASSASRSRILVCAERSQGRSGAWSSDVVVSLVLWLLLDCFGWPDQVMDVVGWLVVFGIGGEMGGEMGGGVGVWSDHLPRVWARGLGLMVLWRGRTGAAADGSVGMM